MEQIGLADNVTLVVKDNVLAVFCDSALKIVGSAIYNGGVNQYKAVLNVGVPEGYSDLSLHLDPLELITSSALKVGLTKDYSAMVTAAKIKNYSLVTKKAHGFLVSVVATAGCQHGESSGEEMDVQEIAGTINIIVLIDGNPSESCMVATLITATEAKSATLRDFDVRSRYTGDSATGSVTDSVAVASTRRGKTLTLGGPPSKLGSIVGPCVRRAVSEALLKQEPFWGHRSVLDRLKERHLGLDKLATELSKIDGLAVSPQDLAKILENKQLSSAYLLAAAKMDDDYKKNLLPTNYAGWEEASKYFGEFSSSNQDDVKQPDYPQVDLPPFLKHVLIKIVKKSLSSH
ncbi:MAG: adenosylcobinamide amidohydrolase [Bacillota bacterium]